MRLRTRGEGGRFLPRAVWYIAIVFTGLVEDIGAVERVEPGPDSRVLTIRPRALAADQLAIGESVAIDGVCLTVTARAQGGFTVLAGEETLRRTTVGDLAPGAPVNLERALRLGDRLGGHLMQGHVDGVGVIETRREADSNLVLEFRAAAPILRYVVEKGSIAVDGISLTVVALADYSFAVALIPHTLGATTLAGKSVGTRVNLEVDMIAKYVERLLAGHPSASPPPSP
jgi:riboflavin synthase